MALVVLTLWVFWYVRRRKQGRGNEEVLEYDKGQPVSSAPNPARRTQPYYVSRFPLLSCGDYSNFYGASFV